MTILLAAVLMGLIGLAFSIFLVVADTRFAVEVDPRISQIESDLPGVNCGGCGYPSCSAYAEAVAKQGAAVDLCVVGGDDTARTVARIMGVQVSDELKEKLVAVVFCQGDSEASAFPGEYRGIADCAAAVYSQDVAKRCKYGCVGLGSCVKACPFDAIHLSATGIPFVDAEKCTACGKCVAACPRDLIELHPVSQKTFVYCKSQDPGVIARKVCKKACIACGICVKAAVKDENPESVVMQGNLAIVNTEAYTAKPEYGEKCPTDSYATDRNMVNRDAVLVQMNKKREASTVSSEQV
ncbi:MAG TPA: RnfABCDGE type electron transport complex subunit B [Spirochaetia bacterium]|nr:RnfABCDGE type electron transport complex subunit B [Spirochaetia bacterium]